MHRLRHFSPIRRSLRFDLVGQRHVDEFFEKHFCALVVETHALVSMVFCPNNEDKGKITSSPWKQEYPRQFDQYAELLARPDPSRGDWEMLLSNREERKHLLQAIITKILETEAFSSLLFGAGPEHRKVLETVNASSAEGFRRSSLRAQTNLKYLEDTFGEPPLFWDEVDNLCARVVTVLAPLYKWTTEVEGSQSSPIMTIYQSFHDVISYACWLSVCIQTSPGIIDYDWVAPGDLYHLDQVNLNHELYEESMEAARGSEQEMAARVKICVVPKMVRYKPALDAMGTRGTESYTIMQPHVLYYHGRKLDQDENDAYVSLPTYLDEHKLRRDRGISTGSPTLILVVIVFVLWMLVHALDLVKQFITNAGVV